MPGRVNDKLVIDLEHVRRVGFIVDLSSLFSFFAIYDLPHILSNVLIFENIFIHETSPT